LTRAEPFLYTGTMSRSFRPFLLPLLSVSIVGCSSHYTALYSPARRSYVAPQKVVVSKSEAEKLLGPEGGKPNQLGGMPPGTPPGELPPAPIMPFGGEMPAADPLNMQPVDPAAPPAAPVPPPPL